MIKTDEYNGVCVLTVIGDLAGDDCRQIRRIVEQQVDTRQIASFAVDLEQCQFIDSEGLETLLWVKNRCDDLFGMMKVIKPDEHCQKIFEMTRLDRRFDVEEDLTTAMKSMR